jgi:hypothetical protein
MSQANNCCGCCGRPFESKNDQRLWCTECDAHVTKGAAPPWERTYAATHAGAPCPFDAAGDKPYNFAEVEAKNAVAGRQREKESVKP